LSRGFGRRREVQNYRLEELKARSGDKDMGIDRFVGIKTEFIQVINSSKK